MIALPPGGLPAALGHVAVLLEKLQPEGQDWQAAVDWCRQAAATLDEQAGVHLELQRWCTVLADLYRCEHGVREGDGCAACPGRVSAGNPLLLGVHGAHIFEGLYGTPVPPRTLGFGGDRRPVVLPPRFEQTNPEAWRG